MAARLPRRPHLRRLPRLNRTAPDPGGTERDDSAPPAEPEPRSDPGPDAEADADPDTRYPDAAPVAPPHDERGAA